MAKITITEKQGWKCVEALDFTARVAEERGEDELSLELKDVSTRIRRKLVYVDQKMREDGRRE